MRNSRCDMGRNILKKILITGAGGFIGRNLVEHYKGVYDISHPHRQELELLDAESVKAYLKREKFDIVIHTANCNDFRHNEVTDFEVLQNNLRMFYNLERNSSYFERMYYLGSGAEYDMNNYIPHMNEEYFGKHTPQDAYGLSKYVMARECMRSNNIYDLVLFGVYGKYEEWQRRFISNNICRSLFGMSISIRQNRYFDYLYINDLVEIIKWFIENEPKERRYNICTGKRIDLLSIAKIIENTMHNKKGIEIFREGLGREYTGDNHKLLNEMGNYSFRSIEQTISELIDFYQDNIENLDKDILMGVK